MKGQNHAHLLEEQVLWAVIGEKELGGETQQHLRHCPACRQRVAQFHDGLEDFGLAARGAVPPFSRAIRLPAEKPAAASSKAGWLPFFGAAAMAGLLVFFYFIGMETMAPDRLITQQGQESLLAEESLMREIAELAETPLPADMYAMAGDKGTGAVEDLYDINGEDATGFGEDLYDISGEDGIGFDEDFFEFVVPDIQDEYQSELFI